MEQWTEQTSLRLLDLMASTASAIPVTFESSDRMPAADRSLSQADSESRDASARADIWLVENVAAVGDELALLAASDPVFWQWLRSKASSLPAEHFAVSPCDWRFIAERWLKWLAAEPTGVSAQASGHGDARGSGASQDNAPLRERDALYRRVLVAGAQAALRMRALVAERENAHETLARELAYDMAYGLSHELNNPLANIATRARLLAEEESSERKKQLLSAIVDQAMRGCEMIADLMLIARPPVVKLEQVEFGSVVRAIIAKARPWVEARGLSLVVRLPEHAVSVETDRSAIAESMWAIFRNAIEVAHGKITVTLSVVACNIGRGRRVILSIQDDGPGVSPVAQTHAFNPFFSGREAGRGLGVGLAKADRIARLSGGSVSIANAVDGGCVASILMPLPGQSADEGGHG